MDLSFLSSDQRNEVLRLAELNDVTVNDIVKMAVNEWLSKNERNYELRWRFPKKLPDSKPITLDSYGSCRDRECAIRGECAQHETAGDFRMEDGISPMLVREVLPVHERKFRRCSSVDSRYNVGEGFIPLDQLELTINGGIPRKSLTHER